MSSHSESVILLVILRYGMGLDEMNPFSFEGLLTLYFGWRWWSSLLGLGLG